MSTTRSEPPHKKRKLNDDEDDYVPSDPEDEISDYEPSDDQDDFEEFEEILSASNNSNSKQDDNDELKDPENQDDEEDEEDDDDDDMDKVDNDTQQTNDENKPKLSAKDKKAVSGIFSAIQSMTATQLKSLLRNLKSLRSIDGVAIYEDIAMGGKKEELQKRIKHNILMIYLGEIVVPTNRRWGYNMHRVYKDTIDFQGWKLQIKQFINLISAQSSKRSRGKKSNSIFSASLISRLNACNKAQVVSSLELLLQQQENGPDLARALEDLLPKPNLETVFKRHNVLINAISKAQPWTRYGSSGDDYCFKRCRSAINTAKKAIVDDGKSVMQSQEWDTALEYLTVCTKNIDRFPVWDNTSNNCAVRDLKKKLKIWNGKVVKGLGGNVNETQQKRLKRLQQYLKES